MCRKLNQSFEEDLKGARLLAWLYFVNLIFLFRQVDGETVGEKIGYYLNDSPYLRQLQNEISARTGCTGSHFLCPAQVAIAEGPVRPVGDYKPSQTGLDRSRRGTFWAVPELHH